MTFMITIEGMMGKTICVFCSSSDTLDEIYFQAARDLGEAMAQRGWGLVYGGSDVGLMGAVARAVHLHHGTVTGIIPQTIHARGIAYQTADELLVTRDLRERKAEMERRADAFIAMPGGFGTLEEIVEVLTLKQLQLHLKPIIFLNINGFYDPLVTLFEHFYQQKFAQPDSREL
jgi:cytokinin riboside 5'-monophosphate phosphoribohydrolase